MRARVLIESFIVILAVAVVAPGTLVTTAAGVSPYTGVPAAVPGTIPAANFDNGGQGVAYYDSTPGNTGGDYRQTDVDIQPSSEGGHNIGWTTPGEWTNYTVSVAATGNYTVQLRVASSGGATMHVGFNGPSAGVWPSVAIPDTGGWQIWTTVTVPVSLHAGLQQLTIYFDTGYVNFAFVTVAASSGGSNGSSTPYTGTPAAIPGTIQAANFDNGGEGVAYHDTTAGNTGGVYRATDVDIQQSVEGGYNVGWIDHGEWLNYSVNVASAGSYVANLRVAALTSGGQLHIGFSGSIATWVAAPVPATGGWQNWTTIQVPVTLGAGPQMLTLYFDTSGFNVASMNIAANTGSTSRIPPFSHAYVIVLENHELSDIIGNPAAPYINQLAGQYGLATNYAAVTHPSLPNYMSLTGGNTYFSDDCVGCTVDAPNIGDQLEAAGLSWKGYMEDMPGPCGASDTSLYATKHDPFIHYTDILSNASRCQTHVVPLTAWRSDVAAGAVPRFVWITPNLCSDMHDCGVSTGDAWLANIVPQITSTPDFGSSVLFVVWDEGSTNTDGGGLVPLIVVSPLVSPGFRSSIAANHFSLLRTLEDAWNLPPLMQAASARSLSEFFQR